MQTLEHTSVRKCCRRYRSAMSRSLFPSRSTPHVPQFYPNILRIIWWIIVLVMDHYFPITTFTSFCSNWVILRLCDGISLSRGFPYRIATFSTLIIRSGWGTSSNKFCDRSNTCRLISLHINFLTRRMRLPDKLSTLKASNRVNHLWVLNRPQCERLSSVNVWQQGKLSITWSCGNPMHIPWLYERSRRLISLACMNMISGKLAILQLLNLRVRRCLRVSGLSISKLYSGLKDTSRSTKLWMSEIHGKL